jgi:hypothetical protein
MIQLFSLQYSFIAATNFRLNTVRLVEDFVRFFETSQLHSQPYSYMGVGANVAERGRGRRGDKDGGWRTVGGFDGEGVRQTTMQSVLKLCRDVGGCRLGGPCFGNR